ncbi:MAG: hypothetical protein RBT15_02880 [Gudongella sp.]|jgi:predicted thioesterase|nr:hypothetical protein [Gudongella sp.]
MIDHKIEIGQVSDFTKITSPSDAARGPGTEELYYLVSTAAILDMVIEGSGQMLDDKLPKEYTTVGAYIEIHHDHPTLVGESVNIRIKVENIEGSIIFLGVEGFDAMGQIFKGKYERHIVNKDRLMKYAYERFPGASQV